MNMSTVAVSPAERRRAREFALLLEGSRPAEGHELQSLVVLANGLRPANMRPRPEFRAALRESLVAEAAERRVAAGTRQNPAAPQTQRHRVRTVVATGVLVSLVGGVGAAAASTHAVPGDALYGLKRGIESAQLRFAHSDLSRGRELLDQADHRLSEAESLAASENSHSPETTARIAEAIADLSTATRAGADALEASYADTGDVAPLIELQRFVVDQRARLADLSALLTRDQRALLAPLTQLLATLQPHLDSLMAASSAAPGASGVTTSPGAGTAASRAPVPGSSADVTDPITGLTGTGSPGDAGAAVGNPGGVGTGAAASSLPSPVPHVSLPQSPAPSAPLPSVSPPQIPLPSVSVPSVPAPSVPATSTTPALPPVNITPPACIPVPPLTTC